MSSPNAEQDAAVLSGDEQELSKEERLEAARKKFEELKKKKKKSKKKSKKGKEDKDEDVAENDDADSKDATNDTPTDGETKEAEDDESKKEDNKQDEEVASKEPEESEEKKLDTKKDVNKAEHDVKEDAKSELKTSEDVKVELKTSDNVKVELKEDTKDKLTAKAAEGSELKMESVKENGEDSKKDPAADKKTDGINTHTNAEEVKEKAVDIGTEAPSNDEKNENANHEKAKIKTEAEKAEKIDLVASVAEDDEVTSLKATIEQQKSTIKKLRDENTDLKLSRMDLQDRIVELESQLKNSPLSTSTSEVTKDSPQKQQIKPAKPVFTQNDYASVSQQNFASFSHTDDFREKLMVWKGWQVDMRLWNATTNTQKISF